MQLSVDKLTSTPSEYAYELDAGWWREHMPRDPSVPGEPLETIRVDRTGHGAVMHCPT